MAISMAGTPMPPTRKENWDRHEQAVREEAKKPGKAFLLMMLERQRVDYEAGRFPWAWDDPPDEENSEREPLARMRQAYDKLRSEIGQLTVKEQHARILRELGIIIPPRGYGYETFRCKVIVS
jgi:hypothetical protein